ncbi:MAG: S-methyl-5-thioribose-1-phosphate isomerase [Bacteroidota bacterium]
MRSIEWLGSAVRFIDQTKLPSEEKYIDTSDYRVIADAIRTLKVRGAPLIGIAAAYGTALAALQIHTVNVTAFKHQLNSVIDELESTRPTAVNLKWALNKMKAIVSKADSIENTRKELIGAAIQIHQDDADRCERIGKNGVSLIPANASILTHCNTGALATGGDGTALNVVFKAHQAGMVKHVYIDETRPLLQGARLTAWELMKAQVPCTLITDNMAASLMFRQMIDVIIVGADRIARNGDTANKIGTYSLAVLAQHHKIPFYIAAPTSTIDSSIINGEKIPIEERSSDEITLGFGKRTAPEGVHTYNPAFDITPAEFITAIITEEKVFRPPYDFNNV